MKSEYAALDEMTSAKKKSKQWEKYLTNCRFIHEKPHTDWHGIEPGLPSCVAS
jgi:hypothetical protein